MPSHEEHVARWLDVLEGKADRLYSPSSSTVWARGDTVYSYGTHFPMATFYPATRRRRRPLFLLNGDRFSNTTTRHQSTVRGAIGMRARDFGADVLIVPFSALESAGIERASIVPLEVRPDRTRVEYERCPFDLDDVGRPGIDGPTVQTFDHGPHSSAGEVFAWTLGDGRRITRTHYTRAYDYTAQAALPCDKWSTAYLEGRHEVEPHEGGWRIVYRRHLLGDALFVADVHESRRVMRPWTVRDVVRAATRAIYYREDVCDALERIDTEEGIGETVTVTRRRRFVSSFDENESPALYFLATLPTSSRAATVEAAILDLCPPLVHAAIARGRDVRRQGDIFFVSTTVDDDEIAALCKRRARLTQWSREASPRPGEIGYGRDSSSADYFGAVRAALRVHGTTHTATEVVHARGGAVYVRGIVRHVPTLENGFRTRDHADLKLGEGWYLAVRNTVPRQRPRV